MAAAEMISANNGSMSIIDALLSVGADVNVASCASGRVSDRGGGAAQPSYCCSARFHLSRYTGTMG